MYAAISMPELFQSFWNRLDACVERNLSAAREAHQRDPLRVNAGMFREYGEAAVDIDDHIQATELRLIGLQACKASARETVECEVDTPIWLSRVFPTSRCWLPCLHPCTTITRRHPFRPLHQSHLPSDGDRLSSLVAGQKLLIRKRQRLDWNVFSPWRGICRESLWLCARA